MAFDLKLALRSRLEARRAALAAEIDDKLQEARDQSAASGTLGAVDGGDRATRTLEADIDLAQAARDGEELRRIEAALERMAGGTFGLCTACGNRIALERLLAQPEASRCACCQRSVDTQHAARSNF